MFLVVFIVCIDYKGGGDVDDVDDVGNGGGGIGGVDHNLEVQRDEGS